MTASEHNADPELSEHRSHREHRSPHPVALLISVVLATAAVVALAGLVVTEVEPHPLTIAPQGPFYTAPDPLPSAPPGTILRTEPVTGVQGVPEGTQVIRILYLSNAFDTGEPIAVSGVLFVPPGEPPPTGRPIVAWSHPTTGVASPCAPSLLPDAGASRTPGLSSFLGSGWIVVSTDYPGLGTQGPHPYLVGKSEAIAVLDSVRAARSQLGDAASNRFVVWGHSQGGHAALFTGLLAASYAPDLELLGVAAAAPASQLGQLLDLDIGTVAGNVLGSQALVAWSEVFPDTDLEQIVSSTQVPLARAVANRCITTEGDVLADLPDAELLRLRFLSRNPTATPPWNGYIAANTPASSGFAAPLLITQGSVDPIVRPEVTQQYVQDLCDAGATVDFQWLNGVGHTQAGIDSAPLVALWAQDRFNAVTPPNDCASLPPLPSSS